jgi:hypothetical protein
MQKAKLYLGSKILISFSVIALMCISVSTPVFAQPKHFIEISSQYPLIPGLQFINPGFPYASYLPSTYGYIINEEYKSKPGFNIKVGQHFKLPFGLGLKTGTGISYINFRRSINVEMPAHFSIIRDIFPITGQPIGSIYGSQFTETPRIVFIDPYFSTQPGITENAGKTDILLMSIPLSITYPVYKSRLVVGAGLSGHVVMWSSQVKTRMEMNYITGARLVEYKDKSSDGLTNFLLNAEMSISWLLTNRLSVAGTYSHGLTPIYDPDLRFAGKSYIRNVSLGIGFGL